MQVIVISAITLQSWAQSGEQAEAEVSILKDRSAIVLTEVKPNFPLVLKGTRIFEGGTKVVFMVGKDGEIRDFVVVASTHPAFSDEALRTIKKWKISPAINAGQPVESRFVVNIIFKQKGIIIINNPIGDPGDNWQNQIFDFYYRVSEVNELDEPLKTVSKVIPYFPEDMKLYERSGQALVEFFVDPDGNVLAPGILSSTNDQCAYSALSAIVGWKFNHPRKKGKSVYVRARQPFFFQFVEPEPARLEDKGVKPISG